MMLELKAVAIEQKGLLSLQNMIIIVIILLIIQF